MGSAASTESTRVAQIGTTAKNVMGLRGSIGREHSQHDANMARPVLRQKLIPHLVVDLHLPAQGLRYLLQRCALEWRLTLPRVGMLAR